VHIVNRRDCCSGKVVETPHHAFHRTLDLLPCVIDGRDSRETSDYLSTAAPGTGTCTGTNIFDLKKLLQEKTR
jgi:hypothetical protein